MSALATSAYVVGGIGVAILVGIATACVFLVHRVPKLELRGKTVLLTGGSTGIGLELAVALAAKGARVAIAARRKNVLEDAVKEIKRRAGTSCDVIYVTMDVSDEASVARGVAEVRRWAAGNSALDGEIDVLICNAGYSIPSRFLDISAAHGKGMMEVNYFGCVNVVRSVIPRMYERHFGRVILVSSMAGTAAVAGFSLYAPTKAAIRAFAVSLDMESAARGVRVQVINPPDVATPGFEEENKVKSEECKKICELGGTKPMQPAEFAKATVSQIENYTFQINVGFDATLMAMGTAAMDPPTSVIRYFGEVMLGGVIRLVLGVYIKLHYGIVRKVLRKDGLAAKS